MAQVQFETQSALIQLQKKQNRRFYILCLNCFESLWSRVFPTVVLLTFVIEGCPVHFKRFSSVFGPHLLDTSCETQNCLQIMTDVPGKKRGLSGELPIWRVRCYVSICFIMQFLKVLFANQLHQLREFNVLTEDYSLYLTFQYLELEFNTDIWHNLLWNNLLHIQEDTKQTYVLPLHWILRFLCVF